MEDDESNSFDISSFMNFIPMILMMKLIPGLLGSLSFGERPANDKLTPDIAQQKDQVQNESQQQAKNEEDYRVRTIPQSSLAKKDERIAYEMQYHRQYGAKPNLDERYVDTYFGQDLKYLYGMGE